MRLRSCPNLWFVRVLPVPTLPLLLPTPPPVHKPHLLLQTDELVVAGLGDSNGILSCALSQGTRIEDNGWTKLEDYPSDGCNTEHRSHIVWKEIMKTHSPSREDERRRIEEANGWITTETEISCSQIHRINWNDCDVIDIVGRSMSNGKAEVGRILSISRVCGDLAVSRAIGDKEYKAAYNTIHTESVMDEDNSAIGWKCSLIQDHRVKGDLISSIPDVSVHSLLPVIDEFLLLACDGLWDVMDSIDAVRITRNLLFQKGFNAKESVSHADIFIMPPFLFILSLLTIHYFTTG